jgi:uncharacterized protein (TIGR02679 family)
VVSGDEPPATAPAPRPAPPSLLDGDLPVFWQEVARRLERNGEAWRGRLRLAPYSTTAARTLLTLVGRPGAATIDLGALEAELVRLGLGADLVTALIALGHPVSPLPAERRADRARLADGRRAARQVASEWPEPWALDWVDDLVRTGLLAGLGPEEAVALLGEVRRVLDAVADGGGDPLSRTDLAATVLGSAHALDDGTRVERATARALVMSHAMDTAGGIDPWAAAGLHRSLVAGAAFTWRLPLVESHPLTPAVRACDAVGVPFVVTRLALQAVPLQFTPSAPVLVVENPRVLEYAAQTGARQAVVCANGNPSATVSELLGVLLASGDEVAYHGDFDTAGLEICARMHARGLRPWRMSATDYLDALEAAKAGGVELPVETRPSGPTPWDPDLRLAFEAHRRIVHEERLLDRIVTP